MHFKKVTLLSGLTLLAGSIVVPPGSSVNRHTTTTGATQTELADGIPLPPLPPRNGALLIDGMPLPPLPPSAAA